MTSARVKRRAALAGTRGRRWVELSGGTRTAIVAVGAIEVALTATAAIDLYRRPREEIRGSKTLWWPVIFIQPVGPVAYLAIGRLPPRPHR